MKKILKQKYGMMLTSHFPIYKNLNNNDLPKAKKILKNTLNIPFHEKLKQEELAYVVENLNYSIKVSSDIQKS